MRVVGYCRVSTENQEKEGTIEIQEKEIRAFCDKNGYTLTGIFKDEGVSGAKELENRPGLKALFDFLEEDKDIQVVVIWKLDRLARDLFIQEFLIRELEKRGVKLLSIHEPDLTSTNDPLRIAFRQFLGIVAELEKAFITMRLQAGRKNKIAKGGYAGGRPALGYKAKEKDLVIDERKASLVRLIYNLREDGKSLRAIAKFLNDNNIPSPQGKTWKAQTVHYILKNKTYQGFLRLKDLETYRGNLDLLGAFQKNE